MAFTADCRHLKAETERSVILWLGSSIFVLEKLEALKVTHRSDSHCGEGWRAD